MSVIDSVLSRVDVKQTGARQWAARCPVPGHGKGLGDRSRSLSIAEADDGRALLNCHAGCSVSEIVSAVGLELQDLFPPKEIEPDYARLERGGKSRERRPFLPATVFEIARQEIGVAAIIACDMHAHKEISEDGYKRLFTVVERLDEIGRSAYGR